MKKEKLTSQEFMERFDVPYIAKDFIGGIYGYSVEPYLDSNSFIWKGDCKYSLTSYFTITDLIGIPWEESLRELKSKPYQPTHEEIMTNWFWSTTLNTWFKIAQYYPLKGAVAPYDRGGGFNYTKDWFKGKIFSKLPYEGQQGELNEKNT